MAFVALIAVTALPVARAAQAQSEGTAQAQSEGAAASAGSAPAIATVQPGQLALMPSASNDAAAKELSTALDPVVLAQLEAVVGVSAAARLALDLPAMQIALDCVGETPECLRAVTAQSNTDSLLAPSVQSAGDELVVTLLYFDARGQGELRSVVRRVHGKDAQKQALDAVPDMLKELFGIVPAEPASSEPSSEPAPVDQGAIEPAAEPEERAFPIGPVVVGAVGVVLIGVGTGLGLAAKSSEDEYAGYDPTREPASKAMGVADEAVDAYERGRTQALLSNISFGVGAAAVAAGAVWLVVALSSDGGASEPAPGEPSVALAPAIAPGELGMTVRGSL